MQHVIIESIACFQAAFQEYSEQTVDWRSTSPGLIEKLSYEGVHIRNMEEDVKPVDKDLIGFAAHDFALQVTKYLNVDCTWRQYVDFNHFMSGNLFNLFNVLFYKGWLLERELNKSDNDLVCVGDPKVRTPTSLDPRFNRFDTLFAFIAGRSNCGIKLVHHKEDRKRLDELEKWVKWRPIGFSEKLLSIMNNTTSSFVYKVWCKLAKKGIINTAQLWPKPRSRIFVHKNCELIGESFLGLLLRGSKFKRMPKLPEYSPLCHVGCLPDIESIKARITTFALVIANKHGLNLDMRDCMIGKVCADVIAERICVVLTDLYEQLNDFTKSFKKLETQIGDGKIFTNYLTSPIERLFGDYCLAKNVKITAFEHGIIYGLSMFSKYNAPFVGIVLAQIGVYHWRKSLEDFGTLVKHQRIIIGGIPKVTSNIKFHVLQRWIGRQRLNISDKSHVVIYVAGQERNNMTFAPYAGNDHGYFTATEAIVEELSRSYPESVILLKLYPSHRYSESCEFLGLVRKCSNLRVVKDVDFRFIRAVADIIALSSSQSTIGWALGANCKTLFYELEASPAKLSGKIQDSALPGVRRVIELDNFVKDSNSKGFIKDSNSKGFIKELLA